MAGPAWETPPVSDETSARAPGEHLDGADGAGGAEQMAQQLAQQMAEQLAGQFDTQAIGCRHLGSPVWADMCERLAVDLRTGGRTRDLLEPHAGTRWGLALPLRLLGGAHRLALTGDAPALAATLPSCGATSVDPDSVWTALSGLIDEAPSELVAALDLQVQTNEVGRSAALAIGLARLAERWSTAVDLAEIGSSAGLNLQLDRFAYQYEDVVVGAADSPVRIIDIWDRDPCLGALADLRVDRRSGCDVSPVDPTTSEGALRLRSFVWPDQTARFARLEGAIDLATRTPPTLSAESAATFVPEILDRNRAGGVVIFHSIMWQYVDKAERVVITDAIEAAGAVATADRPVAWLTYEPDPDVRTRASLRLRSWPTVPGTATSAGETEILAIGGFHGEWVGVLR